MGQMVSVVMVLLLLGVLAAIIKLLARQYIRVAPNEVLVKFGRRYKMADGRVEGFKLVPGGASFIVPLLEQYRMLPLDAFQVKFQVTNVPSEEGVLVTVAAVASLKIGTEQTLLDAAVRRFLNRNLNEIKTFAQEVLEGGLRGVVAQMKVEELVKERTAFGNKVQEQVTQDLTKLGLVVDNFLIQDINDEGGYIQALGVKRTAEVKRDASIAQADADRDQIIRVAEAQRESAEKSAVARRIGETATALADQQINDAQKARDVQIAMNAALVQAEQAKVPIAAQIAAAEKDRQLRTALVAAEEAEVVARTALQQQEKKRHDAELEASVIVDANRQKEAKVIIAEGTKQAAILTAEGQRRSIEELASAEQTKREREASGLMEAEKHTAEGRKAQAEAQQAELVAHAEGTRAQLVAAADGRKAQMLAEAEGQKAQLLAVAAGVAEKAKAYQLLDATGKLLEILKASPELVEKIGQAIKTAGEGTLAPMAQAIGTGLSNVDEIRIVDLGGSKEGTDPVSRFLSVVPKAVFNLAQNTNAIPGTKDAVISLFKKAGIDLTSAVNSTPAAPAAPAATGSEVPR
jgi:flotillin